MGRVRALERTDIPEVAGLYQTTFGPPGSPPPPALSGYLEEVFFRSPWYDAELPSLIYEDSRERIVGFLGVIPRPMSSRGRSLRLAVGTSFMVAPGNRHTLAAIELLKHFLLGPQDLTVTDAASDTVRRLWEALGGSVALLNSMYWTRTLRPCRYALNILERKRPPLRPFRLLSRPLCNLADAVATRIPPHKFHQQPRRLSAVDFDVDTFLDCLTKLPRSESMRPEYDSYSIKWLLNMATQKKRFGRLRSAALRTASGDIAGWWLYYLNRGGISQVLQFGATRDSIHDVMDHLFHDASRQESVAICGRMEPTFAAELCENFCSFKCGSWTLIHSSSSELLRALSSGDAVITRLEGEWWTCFNDFSSEPSP